MSSRVARVNDGQPVFVSGLYGESADPVVQVGEKFAELQSLYDKAWDSLVKKGAGDRKTQEKREAVAHHIMAGTGMARETIPSVFIATTKLALWSAGGLLTVAAAYFAVTANDKTPINNNPEPTLTPMVVTVLLGFFTRG